MQKAKKMFYKNPENLPSMMIEAAGIRQSASSTH